MKFTDLKTVNWTQFSVVVGTVVVLWAGLATVIPEPWYSKVTVVLAAIQTALVHLLKASKPEEPVPIKTPDSY